ncbi:polyketide synthase family protein [Actinoalloteichus sp. GBA129-24]|nr:polyketide synthase family protein [Actinoalloteichus sp. GBA129-24]
MPPGAEPLLARVSRREVQNRRTAGVRTVLDDAAIIGVTPLGAPSARLVSAVSRAGGVGVLDLGAGVGRARTALAKARDWAAGPWGVRVSSETVLDAEMLVGVDLVIADLPALDRLPACGAVPRLLVEVTDIAEARRAAWAGANGLVLRGNESGGRVGELSSLILLQRLLAEPDLRLPLWICGGIGPRTAAAALTAGAAGVVLDVQLALLAEAETSASVAARLRRLDGSESVYRAGHRFLPASLAPPGAGRNAAVEPTRPVEAPPVDSASAVDDPAAVDLPAACSAPGPLRESEASSSAAPRLASPPPDSLPIGQDGGLASVFAERYGDVGTAVRAVLAATMEAAVEPPPARVSYEDGAFGTRLPIAQGPMTRVSDQAGFAGAVAANGALPFVALALADRERSRALLEQTRDALGDRPWGVGVLGFVPDEVRTAQFDVIREIRPTHAIIAGGRPSQAAALEEAGVRAFVHVPSPTLLTQYLGRGLRRFVFEGAECGGHIGPRNSFPLWEAQVGVLLDQLRAGVAQAADIAVLFAGGVHDDRSAAMVAALAAPLTSLGVEVGVLMGTAYLCTEEAVTHGAVTPVFQQQVLVAEGTELLESAPGHVTRALATPFAEEFGAVRSRLVAEGVPERQIWAELEGLNVGRLRIAAKSVRRTAEGLTRVDADEQLRDGLFMAGQAAVLRSEPTTMADLHEAVTSGAEEFRRERAACLSAGAEPSETETARPLDIAVVGMGCVFPDAPDLDRFWVNLLEGRDSVVEVPDDRWDPALFHRSDAVVGDGRSVSKWGGFLPPVPFDAIRHGIPPAALASIDPAQLLALTVAEAALVDAFGDRDFDRGKTSVVFGVQAGGDLGSALAMRSLLPAYLADVPAELDAALPRLTGDSFPGGLANIVSGRIANRLNLGGMNYTVDAACASSLAALDVACKELVEGTSNVVLCGGVDVHNGISDYLMFSSVGALSPTGRCRSFDSTADGIVLGEGAACVALKRLADARRDGDRVYAVIKGVGSASDGRALGLTAPRAEGQQRALRRAYTQAGMSPAEVGMIEAHGTGTVAGDAAELTSLTAVFGAAGARVGGTALGSVKSQIGHTKCAAGLAGLVKTALALHTGVLPPTLHVRSPNVAYDPETSPFTLSGRARPWPVPAAERAGAVSASGFGGINFHAVLRADPLGPPPASGRAEWPAELFLFRAADEAGLQRVLTRLREHLEVNDRAGRPWSLRDLAATAAAWQDEHDRPVGLALVASDLDELAELVGRASAGEDDPASGLFRATELGRTGPPPEVALLFPGQGSQRPGMLAALLIAFPELHRHLRGVPDGACVVYPPAPLTEAVEQAQRAAVTDTTVAQQALGGTGLLVAELLQRVDVVPTMVAGHSYGELVALCVAGVLSPDDLVTVTRQRAEAVSDAARDVEGAMAAVSAGPAETASVLEAAALAGQVVVANHNAPAQTVVSGPASAIGEAVVALRGAGLGARRIPVACAFHSPLMDPASRAFGAALADRRFGRAELPVWSNRTADRYPADPARVGAELAAQLAAPVRFADQIEAMYEAGARVFVEAGPGTVLTRLTAAVLGDRPHLAASGEDSRPGLGGFLVLLARLAVAGVPVRAAGLTAGRGARVITPAAAVRGARAGDRAVAANLRTLIGPGAGTTSDVPPQRPGWAVDGRSVRTIEGAHLPDGLRPARRIQEDVITIQRDPAPRGDAERLVTDFLRSSREMLAAQRDVLMTYLGAGSAAGPAAPPSVTWAPPVIVAAPVGSASVAAAPAAVGTAEAGPAAVVSAVGQAQVAPSAPLTAVVPAAAVPATEPVVPPASVDVHALVLTVISERTGYPVDLIDPDLDLEADFSIDSIKRTEIAGELIARLGLDVDALPEEDVDELAKARTTVAIAAWLTRRRDGEAGSVSPEPAGTEPAITGGSASREPSTGAAPEGADLATSRRTGFDPAAFDPAGSGDSSPAGYIAITDPQRRSMVAASPTAPDTLEDRTPLVGHPADGVSTSDDRSAARPIETTPSGREPVRHVWGAVELASLTEVDPQALAGARFAVFGAPGAVRTELHGLLERHGCSVFLGTAGGRMPDGEPPADGVIRLDAVDIGDPVLPDLFGPVKAALARPPKWFALLSHADDDDRTATVNAAGLRGLMRTVDREYPETVVRLIEFASAADPAQIAASVLTELLGERRTDPPVIRLDGSTRRAQLPIRADLGLVATTGAGPGADARREARLLGLDDDAVLLVVGGGRGITARSATALAAGGAKVHLAGRTALSTTPESAATAGVTDLPGLRAALASSGTVGSPAEVDAAARAVLARREVDATLTELRRSSADVSYHQLDVLDPESVHQLVKELYTRHGRIDGVVFGAGTIEDRLLAHTDGAAFRRVYDTKVSGASTLLSSLATLPRSPRFVVLFGSISAVLGNRGQAAYAAGNDALEALGNAYAVRTGARTITVHWGPWVPDGVHRGMVSDELGREFARQGLDMIDPDAGVDALTRELLWGDPTARSVLYAPQGWVNP